MPQPPDQPEIFEEPAALEPAAPETVERRQATERLPATDPLSFEGRKSVARAASLLRLGQTVAFPTETVYGLGADALNLAAVARIFAAKQRPSWDPIIVHIPDLADLPRVADLSRLPQLAEDPDLTEAPAFAAALDSLEHRIHQLAAAFWPGPLTLLLPRSAAIPDAVTAGRDRVGVRVPAHPVALALLRSAGIPLAAPSANRFGHTSPTSADHVLADLDGRIAAVLDAGPTTVGVESTVLDPCESPMIVYRPGAVSVAMIEAVSGPGSARLYKPSADSSEAPQSLPSPGVGIRHYAPRARVLLVHDLASPVEQSLVKAIGSLTGSQPDQPQSKLAVMLPGGWNPSTTVLTYPWGPWNNPEILARNLFSGLRALDEAGATVILCPVPEPEGIGAAIRDRLEKAARPT